MSSTIYVDDFRGKLMLHNKTYDGDVVVEQNYAGILMGPVTVSGSVTVEEGASLTVFNSVSVTGTMNVDGDFEVR
jgi:hypothetical protein